MTNKEKIYLALESSFPSAKIVIQDPRNDDHHLDLVITSALFKGQTRLAQHKMIYAVLKEVFSGGLHALSITVQIPSDSD